MEYSLSSFYMPAIVMAAYMGMCYILSMVKKNMSIVDIAWGLGFVLVSWVTFLQAETVTAPMIVGLLLVTIWGGRLSGHIFFRNRGKGEDPRYAAWRKEWGKTVWWRSLLQVFVLQGILAFIVVSPVMLLQIVQPQTQIPCIGGILIWMIGFLFEVIGDAQLQTFLANKKNKGKLCQVGLWKYTRHPNYFGEAAMWWGIWLFVFAQTNAWWTIVSPLVITVLLRFVSGVPMTEKRWEKKPGFAVYKKQTNAMFPWFPRT